MTLKEKPKRIRVRKRPRPKVTVVRKLAYERFTDELPEIDLRIQGLKSMEPLAIQCQGCLLLVATLPGNKLDYLIAMSHFLQNTKAIANKDFRRLCPECQIKHWTKYMSQFEIDDSRHFMLIQAKLVDGILY